MATKWPGLVIAVVLGCAACGDDDGGMKDPDGGVSTAHCAYEPLPATARAGGTVTAGPLMAGAAEVELALPVGSALGAYTARAGFLGVGSKPDIRRVEYSGKFNPSYGIETRSMVKALALSAGGEKIVVLKADLGLSADGVTHEVARRLGPEYHGKVLFAVSHSHSQWGHYHPNTGLGVGLGRLRRASFDRLVDTLVDAAQQAIAAERPARLGVALDAAFDPQDKVTRDRRGENDALAGGPRKDHHLFVIRVDGTDGVPIAILPVFGIHGTISDADNLLASTDSTGGVERAIEESFDQPVVVIHLQGLGGDVSPAGSGGINCPSKGPCYQFAKNESVGRYAQPLVMAVWEAAGAAMQDELALEMLTRSVRLGPDPTTFTVRGGALRYAPWDGTTACDGKIWDDAGKVVSPIDEFNAPFGAALCGEDMGAIFAAGELPGVADLLPYKSCVAIDVAADILSQLIGLDFEGAPICASTRTTVAALRLGDHMIATLPGEGVTLFGDLVRSRSPFPEDKTIVVAYAMGHMGYLLTAEDWLQAGYEPSINFWGPLEGEYIAEQVIETMAMAATDAREDAAATGVDAFAVPATTNDSDVPPPDPAPTRGTVPNTIPAEVYYRQKPEGSTELTQGQPVAEVRRLESAYFVWIGEDPLSGTPRVTLAREQTPGSGVYVDVVRRSGRPVVDGDLILTHTPLPLRRNPGETRTHYWVVEWQAVTPWGTPDLDDLEDRAGVPLGRYRFRVQGTGYTLESSPFEVVPGPLTVGATRSGSMINVVIDYEPTRGWRLIDQASRANGRIPVRRGPVTVRLGLSSGGTLTFSDVALSAPGQAAVDAGGDAGNVTSVTVEDRFGNSGGASL